jgi:hypothetical protein
MVSYKSVDQSVTNNPYTSATLSTSTSASTNPSSCYSTALIGQFSSQQSQNSDSFYAFSQPLTATTSPSSSSSSSSCSSSSSIAAPSSSSCKPGINTTSSYVLKRQENGNRSLTSSNTSKSPTSLMFASQACNGSQQFYSSPTSDHFYAPNNPANASASLYQATFQGQGLNSYSAGSCYYCLLI